MAQEHGVVAVDSEHFTGNVPEVIRLMIDADGHSRFPFFNGPASTSESWDLASLNIHLQKADRSGIAVIQPFYGNGKIAGLTKG
jgi:hypothetical protein